MRKFSSYGPVNRSAHYYVPREELIRKGYEQLVGENTEDSGHYITVWAPRQTGKSWILLQIFQRLKENPDFESAIITMELAKTCETDEDLFRVFVTKLEHVFSRTFPEVKSWDDIPSLFTAEYFEKPVILILDEFDALKEEFINKFAGIFRDIHLNRINEGKKKSREKRYLLHGIALIGVRSVVGIENKKGSPFNVQRSMHIPNLTFDETAELFHWYERENGQRVEPEVIELLYNETKGQPGLTCWFGELLTEGFEEWTPPADEPITPEIFRFVYTAASNILPSNNIMNIISKAKQEAYRPWVLQIFETKEKTSFRFDNDIINFLYMNGIIDKDWIDGDYYVKFASPFVQKRLFNYFSDDIFSDTGRLVDPFEDLEPVLTGSELNIPNLLKLYGKYLKENASWLFKEAPRRSDLRLYEAVYHFNLYAWLCHFLRNKKGRVFPEFPTGNGKIDLMIKYGGTTYGLELKSFSDIPGYRQALEQAAEYGKQMNLEVIYLGVFVEYVTDEIKAKYEVPYRGGPVKVVPVFIDTNV